MSRTNDYSNSIFPLKFLSEISSNRPLTPKIIGRTELI